MSDDMLAQIERWQAAAVAQAAAGTGTEMLSIGPFRAMIDLLMDGIGGSMAVPVEPLGNAGSVASAIDEVCCAFRARRRVPNFEFARELCPELEGLLDGAGFELHGSHALMACRPDKFRPRAASGVEVQILTPDAPDADLAAFQAVRFFDPDEAADEDQEAAVAQVRNEMGQGAQFALGRVGGLPAGSAFIVPFDGVGEVVGVSTLPEFRRRGIASTLTSRLMTDLFAAGGTLAWLDAEDEVARAVYVGLGFRVVGTWLSYVPA